MATALSITVADVEKLVPAVVAQAHDITVESVEDYELACSFLTMVATRKKQVGETFDPIVKKAHAAWKEATEQRKKFLDPLEAAERNVKTKVGAWDDEQERIRLQKEAEATEAARAVQVEEALTEAAQLEASGEKELAEMVLEEAERAPAPVITIASEVPRDTGISRSTRWKWRYKQSGKVRDAEADKAHTLRLLVKAAAGDDRWLAYLNINESALTSDATSKKKLAEVPGVEFYPDRGVNVRSR